MSLLAVMVSHAGAGRRRGPADMAEVTGAATDRIRGYGSDSPSEPSHASKSWIGIFRLLLTTHTSCDRLDDLRGQVWVALLDDTF